MSLFWFAETAVYCLGPVFQFFIAVMFITIH